MKTVAHVSDEQGHPIGWIILEATDHVALLSTVFPSKAMAQAAARWYARITEPEVS